MFKRVLRLGLLALVGSVGLLATSTPAVAEPATGAGVVNGTVNITNTGGVDLTCQSVTFTFSSFVLAGAVEVGEHTFAGTINTGPVSGNSADLAPLGLAADPRCTTAGRDTTLAGEGVINAFTVNGSTPVAAGVALTLGGSCSGQYRRAGGNVVVTLNCTLTASRSGPVQALSSTATGTIVVAAVFVPNPPGNGVTVPVTSASFTGVFTGAGVGTLL